MHFGSPSDWEYPRGIWKEGGGGGGVGGVKKFFVSKLKPVLITKIKNKKKKFINPI